MLRLTSKLMVDLFWSACVDDTDLRSREKQRERERNKQGLRPYKTRKFIPYWHHDQRLFYPKNKIFWSLYVPWTDQPLSPNVITENIWTTPAVTNLEISDLIGWGRSPRTSTRSVYTKVLGRPPWGQVVVSSGSEKNFLGEPPTTTKRQQKFKLQYVSKGGIARYLWIRNDTYVEYSPRFPPLDFFHFLSRKLWGWSGCWNLRLLYKIPSLNKNLVGNKKWGAKSLFLCKSFR